MTHSLHKQSAGTSYRVLDWRKRRSWLARIRHYAGHLLTSELRQQLVYERPKCWSDNLSWLPGSESLLPEFAECLTAYYTHFKGFHGCRPSSLSSYYEKGLLGQNSQLLNDRFREIFSDAPKEDVESAIAEFKKRSETERGAMWLVGCDKFLITRCGHYLIQGSEYIMALAAHLGYSMHGEDYRFRLRKYGVPTVLEVDIPVSLVPEAQTFSVAKLILSEWGQLASRQPLNFGDDPPCFVLRSDIPAESLRDHYHPPKIIDPHRGHISYHNSQLVCDLCNSERALNGNFRELSQDSV